MYLYNRIVALWVGCGDAIDGLAGLALVIDGRLCLSLCWSCGILLRWLSLYSDCLLCGGIPQSGIALLALHLRGHLGRDREDWYSRILDCYSWLDILLGVILGQASCADVLSDTRD